MKVNRMPACKNCRGDLRITNTNGLYGCSCGSLDCMNLMHFSTLKEAAKYAEILYGKPFTELKWEGKKIKSKGKWLI